MFFLVDDDDGNDDGDDDDLPVKVLLRLVWAGKKIIAKETQLSQVDLRLEITDGSVAHKVTYKVVHSCTIFLCCLEGEIYDDPYRNPNMNNNDHLVG